MTVAGVVIALTDRPVERALVDGRRPRRGRPGVRPLAALVVDAALGADLDEVIVVTDAEELVEVLADDATVLLDQAFGPSGASALRAALDWCARQGHEAVVLAIPARKASDAPVSTESWRVVASARGGPVVVGTRGGRASGPVRIDAAAWPLLPLSGAVDALWRSRPELVTELDLDAYEASTHEGLGAEDRQRAATSAGSETVVPSVEGDETSDKDVVAVEALLGRPVAGRFSVVVRDASGSPVVIRNEPFLVDGTPMPTRFWLVGAAEREAVGRLESTGGVRAAETEVPARAIADAHRRYAAERDAAIPADHSGPKPSGGVGGTRLGVKCLHAHLAWYLAGGRDPVGRWVADRLAGELRGAVAALDCGTNSTRLLVLDAAGRAVERRMTITRLGEGVDRTGELSPAAIERTVAVLAEYRDLMDGAGVVAWRATATSAARDAKNAAELFAAAEVALGAPLELLSGAEEGRLAYKGATAGLDPGAGPYLVVDLGGGSTELVTDGTAGAPVTAVSLDVGCVRVTERFLHGDPPTPDEVTSATKLVAQLVDGALDRHPDLREARQIVGVAGTVSTLATLALGLDHHDRELVHHSILTRSTVDALAAQLLGESREQRSRRRGIEAGRLDVIAGGALVLREVLRRTGHDALVVSESDILDAVAAELLA